MKLFIRGAKATAKSYDEHGVPGVEIELDLVDEFIDFGGVKMRRADNGDTRELTRNESREFEYALDEFVQTMLGRALAGHIERR